MLATRQWAAERTAHISRLLRLLLLLREDFFIFVTRQSLFNRYMYRPTNLFLLPPFSGSSAAERKSSCCFTSIEVIQKPTAGRVFRNISFDWRLSQSLP